MFFWVKRLLLSYGRKLNDDITKDETFIFLSPASAEPLSPTYINVVYNKVTDKIGCSNTTIHGLRHTHATILMNNGVPVKAIAERLGNTPEMIHTMYGHVLKEMEDFAVNIFSSSLESGAKSGTSS